MDQPINSITAKQMLQKVLVSGVITYSRPHALARLKERKISAVDCESVLRAGKVAEAEYEHGAWRHHVVTGKLVVIIEFLSEDEVLIVTAWRLNK